MPSVIDRIKNDPRVSAVWDEGQDGWFCNLKPNWINDLTGCGTCHEETLKGLLYSLDSIRLRCLEGEGWEGDHCYFQPDLPPFVPATKRFLKLSATQNRILADRPDDCLEENLREQNPELSEEQVRELVGSVTGLFRYKSGKGHLDYVASTIDVYTLSLLQRSVLEDCFSGSTVCGQVAHLFDDPDPKERLVYANAKRSIHTIARKFREVGLHVSFIPDF